MRSNSMPLIGFALGSSFISLAWHRSAFAGVFSFELYVFVFVVVPLLMLRPCSKAFRKIFNV